jgi:hypothetical protein
MVYLPAEKILIEADAYTPAPPAANHQPDDLELVPKHPASEARRRANRTSTRVTSRDDAGAGDSSRKAIVIHH